MNIWIINHYAYIPSDNAGIRQYSMAKELIKLGHKTAVIASSFYHKTLEEKRLGPGDRWKVEWVHGVPFVWLKTPSYRSNSWDRIYNMFSFSFSLWQGNWMNSIFHPHIVVGSSPHLFGAFAAERLARRLKSKFVFEIRDIWPKAQVEILQVNRWHPFIILQRGIERYLYKHADSIISVLPNGVEHIVSEGGKEEKVEWIPNGIDLDIAPQPSPAKGNEKFIIIYAGAHGPKNALDYVLDAAFRLQRRGLGDRIEVRLIGDGIEKPRLQRRAREEGINNVKFFNPVPKEELHAHLAQADAFIVSRHNEDINRYGTSANKFFDYLAAGRPTVFASEAFNNPFEEAGAGITVKPGDSRAISDAIMQLMAVSAQERWEMGLRGRKYVEKFHSYSKLAARLEDLLQRT